MNYKDYYTGGEPEMNQDDRDREPTSNRSALFALALGLDIPENERFIISGCEVTIDGSGNAVVTAGYIFYDDRIIEVEAQTVADSLASGIWKFEPATTYDADGTKTFIDGIVRETWRNERAIVTNVNSLAAGELEIRGARLGQAKYEDDSGNESTKALFTKVIEIGAWDMDADTSKTVNVGVNHPKIRSIQAMIINDTSAAIMPLDSLYISGGTPNGTMNGGINVIGASPITDDDVTLFRTPSKEFDSVNYDDSTMNRGYITIVYEV